VTDGLEENVVYNGLVASGDEVQLMWKGEDIVEVLNRQ
jgi:hypothetical protein